METVSALGIQGKERMAWYPSVLWMEDETVSLAHVPRSDGKTLVNHAARNLVSCILSPFWVC